ncbi:MAG: sigma-70 family RNA polymerase sigma [Planctomycetota bacterium]|nr:MAG: sigma-70 family RNA polymerase sigma [Planctomycetota bacterium]
MPTYETLVRDYHSLAFRVARSVVRDDASAEDAVQDVYLRFLRDPSTLERAGNLKAFVARAAVNAALDQKRGAGRREKHENEAMRREASMSERANRTNPVEAASRAELRAKVAELLDEQRVAVEMHYFHGLTKEEAAHALQIPAGTVSSRLNAGLSRLRTTLAAAAFGGLLAMLESELSKCAAEELVPANLVDRLLRLSTGGATATGSAVSVAGGRKLAVGAAATVAALFLAFGVSRLLPNGGAEAGGPAVVAAGSGVANAAKKAGATEAASEGPSIAKKTPALPPAADETILEGFLFRRGDGVYVSDVGAWDHRPRQTIWNPDAVEEERWRESLTLLPIAGLVAVEPCGFGAFIDAGGEPESAPRARVKLKVRGGQRPPPAKKADDEDGLPGWREARSFAPQNAELVAVLEREILSPAWLTAWRDMMRATDELWAAWSLQPGMDKRTKVLEAATRFAQAWEIARASRKGESPSNWRVGRESEFASNVADRLRTVGLDRILPAWPTSEELHGVLMDAASPAALRDTVVARWGQEALLLETYGYRSTGPGSWSYRQIGIEEVVSMEAAAFEGFKKELEGIENNRPQEPDTAAIEATVREARERIAATGLTVAPLTSIDRERFIVDCGLIVVSVAQGSTAERAGLKTGDLLWKAVMDLQQKQNKVRGEVPIHDERGLAGYLAAGEAALELKVVRESGVETVKLAHRE